MTESVEQTSAPRRGLKALAGAVVVVSVLGGSGVVLAGWTASGRGSVDARVLENVEATVTGVAPEAALYPGATEPISFRVTNPNPYGVRFNIATVLIARVTPQQGRTCDASNFESIGRVGVAIDVLAGKGGNVGTIPDAVHMLPAAGDGCQGATVTLDVTLSGVQMTG